MHSNIGLRKYNNLSTKCLSRILDFILEIILTRSIMETPEYSLSLRWGFQSFSYFWNFYVWYQERSIRRQITLLSLFASLDYRILVNFYFITDKSSVQLTIFCISDYREGSLNITKHLKSSLICFIMKLGGGGVRL